MAGDPIKIYWDQESAAPKAVVWENPMLIGNVSGTISEEDAGLRQITSASDLLDLGYSEDSRMYKSASVFFQASPTPESLYVYEYYPGSTTSYEDVPLDYTQENTFESPLKPPEGFTGDEKVTFYCSDEDEDGTENYANGGTGMGFKIITDESGNWTGRLDFLSGLSGAECGIVEDLDESYKITADIDIGDAGKMSETIGKKNINMIAMALDNDSDRKNYTNDPEGADDSTVFGESEADDILKIRNAIAGENCFFFYALPGDADPGDEIDGVTDISWKDLKNLVGAQDIFAPIKLIPSADDDMAAGYMGMTAATHPHVTMYMAEPHMGVKEPEPRINQAMWDDAQISYGQLFDNLTGEPILIMKGYTFGSGDFSRVNGARCKYILGQTLINNLTALLAERNTYMSVSGCQRVESRIRGTLNTLIDEGIIDGVQSVEIPIISDLRNNTEAGKIAAQQRRIPAVRITYEWETSVETIVITSMDNALT